jgi:hypothetical protein
VSAGTLPTLWNLTRGEREGRLCIRCGAELGDDAIRVGTAAGYWGAHNRSVAIFECPACSPAQ